LNTHYLDLDLDIRNGKIHSKLFDKRDAFRFPIVNFPDLSGNIPAKQSYGVFVSQLIRYARCCMNESDFVSRTKILVDKLVKQGFKPHILKQVFEKFTMKHFIYSNIIVRLMLFVDLVFNYICFHLKCLCSCYWLVSFWSSAISLAKALLNKEDKMGNAFAHELDIVYVL